MKHFFCDFLESAANIPYSYKVTHLVEKLDIYNGSHHNINTEKNFWRVRKWELYRESKAV